MTLVIITIVLFAVAAVFGAINVARIVIADRAPRATVYTHGAIAALALVLLVIYSVLHPPAAPAHRMRKRRGEVEWHSSSNWLAL